MIKLMKLMKKLLILRENGKRLIEKVRKVERE